MRRHIELTDCVFTENSANLGGAVILSATSECDKMGAYTFITGFDTDAIKKLSVGTEIGYRSIKDGTRIHAKDIMLSYVENGKRHDVSLMTSCNDYTIAFNHRTNSMLVINETEDTGGAFDKIFGENYAYGMITND